MTSLLCGSFHVSSNYFLLKMPCHIWGKQMFFSCVDSFMFLEMTTLVECLFTFGAGKWLLSRVSPFMSIQMATLNKCLVTLGAGKWLLTCMGPFMCLQITTAFECLVTLVAGKWLLSCVCHFMLFLLADVCLVSFSRFAFF